MEQAAVVKGGKLSWSVSRHDTFTRCKRKYWLSYYGAFADPELARLKDLKTAPLWIGNVVHDAIKTFLKLHDSIPDKAGQATIVRQLTHGQLPQDWRFSLANVKKFRLFEHEYGIPVAQHEKAVWMGLIVRCMRSFFESPILAEAMKLGRKAWLSIDELQEYVVDGIPVFAAIDFAYRMPDGQIKIVDWKTGRSVGKLNETQVAAYSLLAIQRGWATKAADVETTLAYLAVPSLHTRTMTEADIAKARTTIQRSGFAMRALATDPIQNTADRAAFPMTTNAWECKLCQYQKVCFPPAIAA